MDNALIEDILQKSIEWIATCEQASLAEDKKSEVFAKIFTSLYRDSNDFMKQQILANQNALKLIKNTLNACEKFNSESNKVRVFKPIALFCRFLSISEEAHPYLKIFNTYQKFSNKNEQAKGFKELFKAAEGTDFSNELFSNMCKDTIITCANWQSNENNASILNSLDKLCKSLRLEKINTRKSDLIIINACENFFSKPEDADYRYTVLSYFLCSFCIVPNAKIEHPILRARVHNIINEFENKLKEDPDFCEKYDGLHPLHQYRQDLL